MRSSSTDVFVPFGFSVGGRQHGSQLSSPSNGVLVKRSRRLSMWYEQVQVLVTCSSKLTQAQHEEARQERKRQQEQSKPQSPESLQSSTSPRKRSRCPRQPQQQRGTLSDLFELLFDWSAYEAANRQIDLVHAPSPAAQQQAARRRRKRVRAS